MVERIAYSQEIEPARKNAAEVLEFLRKEFHIINTDTANTAGDWLLSAKQKAQALEARRKEITGPLLQAKQSADDLFKPVIAAYVEIESLLKDKLAQWTRQIEDQRRVTMQASAAEYQDGGIPTAIIPEPVKVQGVTVTQVWDFEVIDPAQVPRELCSPDDAKIKAHMKIQGTAAPVPGIRFFQKDRVAARAKK